MAKMNASAVRGLLAAGHGVEALDGLVAGLGLHRQAAVEGVLVVFEEEPALAVGEALEDVLEVLVDGVVGLHERLLLPGLVGLDAVADLLGLLDERLLLVLEFAQVLPRRCRTPRWRAC